MTSILAVAIYMNLIPIYSSLGCSKSTAWQSLCRRKCHGKCPHGTKETGHWAEDTPSVLLLPLPINTMLAKWLNWHIGIVHIGVNVLSITGQPAANCCCFCHSSFCCCISCDATSSPLSLFHKGLSCHPLMLFVRATLSFSVSLTLTLFATLWQALFDFILFLHSLTLKLIPLSYS